VFRSEDKGWTVKEVAPGLTYRRFEGNMDGGGSSTLVIAGEGDPKTHVVNRPTDAKGERLVGSHFVLVHE
jgi:exopolysaccharide biosynthesis protein